MPLKISDDTMARIIPLFSDVKERLDGKDDIRLALARLERLEEITSGLVDLADDSETRFAYWLINLCVILPMGSYDGRTNGWYELNANNVSDLRRALSGFMGRVISALEKRDYSAVVSSSKDWFFVFHDLARNRTADVRPSQ